MVLMLLQTWNILYESFLCRLWAKCIYPPSSGAAWLTASVLLAKMGKSTSNICSQTINMANVLSLNVQLFHLMWNITIFSYISASCIHFFFFILQQYWLQPHGGRNIPITGVLHIGCTFVRVCHSISPAMLRETEDHTNIWSLSSTDLKMTSHSQQIPAITSHCCWSIPQTPGES